MSASPAQVALAEMLVLPCVELVQQIERELAANPALDVPDRLAGPPAWRMGAAQAAVEELPAPTGAWADLVSAAAVVVPDDDRWLAEYVLADLGPRGLLGRTPHELATALRVCPDRVGRVLAAIRAVGPPGIAAADLAESFSLQLDVHPDAPPLLRRIVLAHLADVAAARWPAIAVALGTTETAVTEAVTYLRTHLRPVETPEAVTVAPPAPPDVIVRADLTVDIPPPCPGLRLDAEYARLAAQPTGLTPAEQDLVCAQVGAAREFLARLVRRTGTLRRVAEFVIHRQQRFVLSGPAAHAPLTRAEAALSLGLHGSTVGRTVAGKTVLLPTGRAVEFAAFFGRATCVREMLASLVYAEVRPRSDAELAAELARHGYRAARRTVAKYRAQLAIPPADQR
jgi:RNA polymerase sigma-54 factor